jgi:hypothetical protein
MQCANPPLGGDETDKLNVRGTLSNPDYSTYQLLGPRQIRLLVLQKTQRHGDVTYGFQVVDLERQPIYAALSYVWGESETRADIQLGNRRCRVTKNLHNALKRLQAILSANSNQSAAPLAIWADQLCINQEDTDERSTQVRLMAQIYRRARRVYVYLGDSHDDLDIVTLVNTLGYRVGLQAMAFKSWNEMPRVSPKEVEELGSLNWKALQRMITSAWFSRAWVVQEIGLARKATVLLGDHQFEWTSLMDLYSWLSYAGSPLYSLHELSGWTTHAMWVSYKPSSRKTESAYVEYDFLTVLSHTAFRYLATDPRDHIYAFLGHPAAYRPKGSNLQPPYTAISPNYHLSPRDVYVNFAKYWLNTRKDSRLLSCVDHVDLPSAEIQLESSARFPSWCPNWGHQPLGGGRINKAHEPYWYKPYSAAGSTAFTSHFRADVLDLQGHIFGDIRKRLPLLSDLESVDVVLPIIPGHSISSQSAIYQIARLCHNVLDDSLSLFQSRLDAVSAFAAAANLGNTSASNGNSEDHTDAILLQFAEGLNEARSRLLGGEHSEWASRTRMELDTILKFLREAGIDPKIGTGAGYFGGAVNVCKPRRFFITDHGMVGIGPSALIESDQCCIVAGCNVPLILRQLKTGGYLLVGESYVHGVMSGQCLDRASGDGFWETISLR